MSWGDAVMLVNSSFTIAGDMGTEMHMSSSRVLFRALFGQWPMDVEEIYTPAAPAAAESEPPQFSFVPDDVVSDVVEETPAAQFTFVPDDVEPEELVDSKTETQQDLVDAWLDLSGTIYVPGLLHICHNCVKDLGVVLSSLWEAFVGELRHVCRLLSRKRSNARFLATCVTGQYAFVSQRFQSFQSQCVYW